MKGKKSVPTLNELKMRRDESRGEEKLEQREQCSANNVMKGEKRGEEKRRGERGREDERGREKMRGDERRA